MAPPKVPAGWELEGQPLASAKTPPTLPEGWELDQPPAALPVPTPETSMAESALQGYGQGASFGFADELAGASAATGGGAFKGIASAMFKNPLGRAFLRKMKDTGGASDEELDAAVDDAIAEARYLAQGTNPAAVASPYRQARDQARQEARRAEAANPKTFLAANIAGAASVPVPGSGAAKPFQTVIGRSLQNAGKFGLQGGLAGLGNSDAEDAAGIAKDVALGAGVGGGMGLATGPAAYAWARHARPALQSLANSRAVSAVAPSSGLLNRLRKGTGARSEEDIQKLGSDILDLNILRPLGTAAGAKGRNDAVMAFEGANIGAAMDKADDLVAQGVTLPPSRETQRQLVSRALADAADTPATRALRPSVESKLLQSVGDDVPRPDNFPSTFRELWKNKSQLQSVLKPDEFSNEGQKLYRKGVQGYTKGVYGQAEAAIGPDEVAKLRESARRYGTAASIDDMLTEQTTRGATNQPISLGDAARGAAFSDMPGGSSVATLISALMRGRTDATIATGARAMSKLRPNPPSGLMKLGSEATRQALSDDEEDAVQAFLASP